MALDIVLLRDLLIYAAIFVAARRLVRRLLLPATPQPQPLPPGPPGPPGYPVVGALLLLGRAPHVALARLARQYGPIMHLKMGQHGVVVASSPDAARTFLKALDANFASRPVDGPPSQLAYGAQDLVFAEYGPRWKLLRKICSLGLLGPKALEDWAGVRRAEVGRMVRSMWESSRKGEPVEVGERLICGLANMIGLVFEVGAAGTGEFREMVVEHMTAAGLVDVGDYVPALGWMDLQGLRKRRERVHRRFDAMMGRVVAEHQAATAAAERRGKPDMLDEVLALRDGASEGEKLTDVNIKALLVDLFTAGTDTSSSTIEWAIAEMLLNPNILTRAQAEIDGAVGRDRRLEESDIPSLPYLKAICKETFRKHPSTPLNLPRICTQSCEADGYFIPKNTRLLVNIWAIGRDPTVWDDPLEFNPNRFMTPEGLKIDPRGTNFELIPFGAGRRICAGARMGMVVVEYVLGTLIHCFDWKLPEGVELDMEETFGIALQKTVPIRALVSPRLAPHVYA